MTKTKSTSNVSRRIRAAGLAGALSVVAAAHAVLAESPLQSPWVEGFNNKLRLVAGRTGAGEGTLYAGIELVMPKDWKTYWRNPGEAGGIPPSFDFSASENVESVKVLYPAPKRLIDKSGATIGYKNSVVFPVAFGVKDPAKSAVLNLKSEYGVCKDICVPAEASAILVLEPKAAAAASPELADAVAHVPRNPPAAATDPELAAWKLDTSGTKPVLRLEVKDPGGAEGDAFLEAPDGLFVPLPKKLSTEGPRVLYEVDLSDGADFAMLKGKTLTLTLVGAKGQSETSITLEK